MLLTPPARADKRRRSTRAIEASERRYRPDFADQARKLAMLGLKDTEIAEVFNVKLSTLIDWTVVYPEFSAMLQSGRVTADAEVVEALHHAARGYSHPATKMWLTKVNVDGIEEPRVIEHSYMEYYPPNVEACKTWLYNRQSDKWKNSSHQTLDGSIELTGISALLSLVKTEKATRTLPMIEAVPIKKVA